MTVRGGMADIFKKSLNLNVSKCLGGEGYNLIKLSKFSWNFFLNSSFRVDWDKVSGDKKGPTFLHLTWYIKVLMDQYDLIKQRFFEGKRPGKVTNENWLDDLQTPFFLNSEAGSLSRVDLTHLKEALGVDIVSYSYRKILSTFALNHESEEIRQAEMVTLNHSLSVARKHYNQNNALKPQILTQTYVAEEGYLTSEFEKIVTEVGIKTQSVVSHMEKKRTEHLKQSIMQDKEDQDILRRKLLPLGPRKRILDTDFNEFIAILEKSTSVNIVTDFKEKTPAAWRKFLVRSVCSISGEDGDEIRRIWKSMYKGDLKNGIR